MSDVIVAGTQTDVWLLHVEADSLRPAPLVTTPFQDRAPVFSPDGRWIAYVSNKSGRDEIYVLPYPGPGPEHTASTAGGREPVWSRDGTELFYRTEDQLMVVDVELGDRFHASQPRPLFRDVYERDAAGRGWGPELRRHAGRRALPDGATGRDDAGRRRRRGAELDGGAQAAARTLRTRAFLRIGTGRFPAHNRPLHGSERPSRRSSRSAYVSTTVPFSTAGQPNHDRKA